MIATDLPRENGYAKPRDVIHKPQFGGLWSGHRGPTFTSLPPCTNRLSFGRPPNFAHMCGRRERKNDVSENESGPAPPDRQRFPRNKGSVAPALHAIARIVLHAAVVAVIRKVLDQLIP